MASRSMAPDLMIEEGNQSVFVRQPGTPEEEIAAWLALEVCPTAAVEAPVGLARPHDLFPQDLGGGVYRLGHNAKASYGAFAYFGVLDNLKFMVDGPRWSAHIAAWIEARGGLDHILLTHRDDVGDAARYATRFGAKVWIHEEDLDSAPFATGIFRGHDLRGPSPRIKVIAVPGHTRGSVMYLLDDHTLFSGDSLAWDARHQALRGYRRYCWFDWPTQIASLTKLRSERFTRLLAGHGGSVELPPGQMIAKLEAMLAQEHENPSGAHQ